MQHSWPAAGWTTICRNAWLISTSISNQVFPNPEVLLGRSAYGPLAEASGITQQVTSTLKNGLYLLMVIYLLPQLENHIFYKTQY
jgi:hypothetical protein